MNITSSGNKNDEQVVESFKESLLDVDEFVHTTLPPTPSPTEFPSFPPLSCPPDDLGIYIRRFYTYLPHEESLSIYEANDNSGNSKLSVYNMTYKGDDYLLDTFCLHPICYTIELKDSYGDGWSSGSFTEIFTEDGVSTGRFTLGGGHSRSAALYYGPNCTVTIPPSNTNPHLNSNPTPPPPTCNEDEVMVTFIRHYSYHPNEESFNVYEGEDLNGDLIYTLKGTSKDANKIQTIYYCLKNQTHIIEMKDSHGDGWSSGSFLKIVVDNDIIAIFTMTTDSNSSISYGAFIPALVDQPTTNITPPPTPPPTPTPPSTPTPTPSSTNCENSIEVTVSRVGADNATEESFELYEIVNSDTNKLIFEMNTTKVGEQTFSLCLLPRCHLLVMRDSGNNGWSSGSSISFSYNHRFMLEEESLESGNKKVVQVMKPYCPTDDPDENDPGEGTDMPVLDYFPE